MKSFQVVLFLVLSTYLAEIKTSAEHYISPKSTENRFPVPYHIFINVGPYCICDASLVSVDGHHIALTSADCFRYFSRRNLAVVAGDLDPKNETGVQQKLNVNRVLFHQNYSVGSLQNNIAIVFMDGSFKLGDSVQTIPLPMQDQKIDVGSNVTVSGRLTSFNNNTSDLQILNISVVNLSNCQESFGYRGSSEIDENMICAAAEKDANRWGVAYGGPTASPDGHLIGIVPEAMGFSIAKYPQILTKVASFVDWIHESVQVYKI